MRSQGLDTRIRNDKMQVVPERALTLLNYSLDLLPPACISRSRRVGPELADPVELCPI